MSFPKYPAYKDSNVDWLGEVPAHWDVAPAGMYYEIRNGFPFAADNFSPEGAPEHRLIRIRDILGNDSPLYTDEPCPVQCIVENGDILIGMDGDFNVTSWMEGKAKLNQRVCAIRGSSISWDRFFFYGIGAPLKIINDLTFATTVKHLASSQVMKTRFPIPPEIEMENISRFLDHETARIDALIEEQQRLIELLKEKRQAVISHAVTKGLDPTVPMKDSGVEWLGEVPAHWKVSKFGYVSTVVRGGSPRPAGDPELFNGDYSPWVTVAEITKDDEIYLVETETFLTKKGSDQCRVFAKGTLILSNSGATLGVPKILGIDANANDGVVGFECLTLDKEYAYFYLATLTNSLRERIKQGSGQPNLNTDIVKSIDVPIPPAGEVTEIVASVKRIRETFKLLSEEAALGINLLQERRSSLISAAVTGKIDVRGWQPPASTKAPEPAVAEAH